MASPSPSPRGAFIAKLGAWLQLVAALVIVGTMLSMAKTLEANQGADAPARFSHSLGSAYNYLIIANVLSLIGLVLVTVAIISRRYRAAWMFYFLFLYGLLMIGLNIYLLFFDTFSLNMQFDFSVFFVYFAMVKKGEFQQAAKEAYKLPSCYKLDP